MFDITDSELIMLCRENNEEALNLLNRKYTAIISIIINKYYSELKKANINIEELKLSCSETLNEALENYNSLSKASFNTYLTLLIERKIKKIIITTYRKNKKTIEESFGFIDDIVKYDLGSAMDPLNVLCKDEKNQRLQKIIIETLTNKELLIFSLLLEGLTCKDIASTLMQSYKRIYKNIQNIRKKITQKLQEIMD